MPKPSLTEKDYQEAADRLGCEVAAIKAVAEIESGPYGAFLDTDEPVLLFERHLFRKLTNGKYDEFPDISNPRPGGYGKVNQQHARLQKAAALDRNAALQSASWGRFQVLGVNWSWLGYESLQEFINAMYSSEKDHLDSFVRFVEKRGLVGALRRKDWRTFARLYNGPAFAKHKYHIRMAAAYKKHAGESVQGG